MVPAQLVPGTGVGGLAGVVDPGAGGSRSGRVPPEPSVGVSALPATNLNLFWGWNWSLSSMSSSCFWPRLGCKGKCYNFPLEDKIPNEYLKGTGQGVSI